MTVRVKVYILIRRELRILSCQRWKQMTSYLTPNHNPICKPSLHADAKSLHLVLLNGNFGASAGVVVDHQFLNHFRNSLMVCQSFYKCLSYMAGQLCTKQPTTKWKSTIGSHILNNHTPLVISHIIPRMFWMSSYWRNFTYLVPSKDIIPCQFWFCLWL